MSRAAKREVIEVGGQVGLLLQEMERLGERGADGKLKCKFGALIKDDRCSNIFEVRLLKLLIFKYVHRTQQYDG
jgi:hypothetical protein